MKVLRLLGALALVLFLSCSSVASAVQNIPAPFESAKSLAMATPLDANGNYVLQIPSALLTEVGIEYILGYLPDDGIIGVGMTDGANIVVFMYCEKDGSFSTFYNGQVIPGGKEKVIENAFRIFRKMVAGQTI